MYFTPVAVLIPIALQYYQPPGTEAVGLIVRLAETTCTRLAWAVKMQHTSLFGVAAPGFWGQSQGKVPHSRKSSTWGRQSWSELGQTKSLPSTQFRHVFALSSLLFTAKKPTWSTFSLAYRFILMPPLCFHPPFSFPWIKIVSCTWEVDA